MPKPSLSLGFMVHFVRKDLLHSWPSTLLLVSVISFVCLPNFILLTLKEHYVGYMKDSILKETSATRLEIQVRNLGGGQGALQSSDLVKLESDPKVFRVVPHRTRIVGLISPQGRLRDYDAYATAPGDPDLLRYHFTGNITGDSFASAILSQSIRKHVEISEEGLIDVIVSRTHAGREQNFIIPCEVLGWVDPSSVAKVYLPLRLMDRLEYWRMGYEIKELNLPPSPRQEEELLDPTAVAEARLYLPDGLGSKQQTILRSWNLIPEEELSEKGPFFLLKHAEGLRIKFEDWQELHRELLVSEPRAAVVPSLADFPKISWDAGSYASLELFSAVPNQPDAGQRLEKGNWLLRTSKRFDVVLPPPKNEKDAVIHPHESEIQVSGTTIPVRVIGTSKDGHAYAGSSLTYRLAQLEEGKVTFHADSRTFGLPFSTVPEVTYIAARVHAENLEAVPDLSNNLRDAGFLVSSAEGDINSMRRMSRLLTNLVLLIFITGSLAFVFALVGILSETVQRRRRLIGSLLAMGTSRWDLIKIYLFQVSCYAGLGYIIVSILQAAIAFVLDTEQGHLWLGIAESNPLFTASIQVRFIIFVILFFLCGVAGTIPAYKASRLDPSIILKE